MDLTKTAWRKSSYSGANGGECLELSRTSAHIVVRDSKDPDGPKLTVNLDDFRHLTLAIKNL